jgi:hypothetical protein
MSNWVHRQGCQEVLAAVPQATWAMSQDMQGSILDDRASPNWWAPGSLDHDAELISNNGTGSTRSRRSYSL